MTGGVNKIELIYLPVACLVIKLYGVSLYRYSAFTLKIHIIQKLLCHVPFCNSSRKLEKPVGKRGFSVIDMCNY